MLLLLASCSNKNTAYRRFNVNRTQSSPTQPLLFNRVIYCGIINHMATEETGYRVLQADTFFKDTLIHYLVTALRKDSLFKVQPFVVQPPPNCVVKDYSFYKPLLDSLSKNYQVNQPHVLPIINFWAHKCMFGIHNLMFFSTIRAISLLVLSEINDKHMLKDSLYN